MSIDTSGPVAIQARIALIQSRFAPVAPPVANTGGTADASTSVSFQAALARQGGLAATGSAVTTPAASPATSWPVDLSATTRPATLQGYALPADALSGLPSLDASPAGTTGDQVVADARRYLGVPYLWGSTDPAKGLDCSGLVQRVYADMGIQLPRVSHDQARAGRPVASLADARPGDLLAFERPVNHVAIYIGGGRMIAAPEPGEVVKEQRVYETPSAIRRILPDATAASAAAAPGGSVVPAASPVTAGTALAAAGAPYQRLFELAGQRYGVDPGLLAAVAKTESGFNPSAVSGAGAIGLMQLMPGTARGLGVDPRDPAQAVDGAARLLAEHLRTFGSVPLALAAYNAGPGAVQRYGGVPPYAETQAYVRRVMASAGAAA